MSNPIMRPAVTLALLAALSAAPPAIPTAQAAGDWEYAATIYGWLPSMGGTIAFPLGGSVSAEMDPSDVLDALNFAAFGIFEARKDDWGLFTDVIYLDLGATKNRFRDFTIGGQQLPAQLEAKADIGLSGWVWTLGGTYLAVDAPAHSLSLLAGARLLDLTNDLTLTFSGDITGTPIPGRRTRSEANLSNWDAVVGLKGRVELGDEGQWFVPYYADIGTGQSDLTWQAILGLGYAFDWGDLTLAWRYMDYDFGSDGAVEDLWQSGVAIGATFHF